MQDLAHSIIEKPFRTCFKWTFIGLLGILFLYQLFLFALVLWYSIVNPSSTAFMRAQALELREQTIQHQWVNYEDMGRAIKQAVIASEDSRFIHHNGIEWEAIQKAIRYNLRQFQKNKEKVRGGSTITQQLAKNLFLSADRSYFRKGQELIITYMLELLMSKKRILELYLNTAQFGHNIFGVEAASQHYFKKHSKALHDAEAARLAVLLPNPSYYGKYPQGPYISRQTNIIRARMRQVIAPSP